MRIILQFALYVGMNIVPALFPQPRSKLACVARTLMYRLRIILFLPALAVAAPPVLLPGTLQLTPYSDLTGGLTGWDFTYSEPGWDTTLTGLIVKPSGAGPFPIAVLCHGKGGNAVGFGKQKSQDWFGPSEYLTISMNLTHGGKVFCADPSNQCGGSPENIRRAQTAVSIATSQALIDQIGDVMDRDNLFLYGNSLGAATALEFAETTASQFRAVALSAGGILRTRDLAYVTPSGKDGVANVGAPIIHLHGRRDNVIRAKEEDALNDALNLYDKTHQQIWFPSGGHNIATAQSTQNQVGAFILEWFAAYYQQTAPLISTMTPTEGYPGSVVIFTGSNFGTNIGGNSAVTFAGVKGTPSYWETSFIASEVPAGATTGAVQVIVPVGPVTDPTVEKPVGGGVRSNRMTFTITP